MTTTRLNLTKKFTSYVKRTDRVIKVAASFGIGLEEREFVLFENLSLAINQGDVIFVTGQSGSGKSCLLHEISMGLSNDNKRVVSIDTIEFDDRPIIDQIGKDMTEATQLLSLAGISDAYLYIRSPDQLSDGQRYRFRLAKLLEQDADVWVADEFGAILDRVTAKVIAFNMQKVARANGKTLLLATTHTDLIEELGADMIIRKRFQDRIDITEKANAADPH